MNCLLTSTAIWRSSRKTFCSISIRSLVASCYEHNNCLATTTSSKVTVDDQLRKEEYSVHVADDAVKSVCANRLAANNPCEDHHSFAKCLPSNAWLLGVFDGHGGAQCSRHLASRLFDYISVAVLPKHRNVVAPADQRLKWMSSSWTDRTTNDAAAANLTAFERHFERTSHSTTVRRALQSACVAMDDDICQGAMPNREGQVCRTRVGVATAGSCATVAHIRGAHLHLANVGDSAAVLGVCGRTGAWTARQLSREHCCDNPDEVKRIRGGHPAEEMDTVLRGGRLLGQLLPLRAFGDVRYKWPASLQQVVLDPIYGGCQLPPGLVTPPYLTALPEVFYHRLTPNDRFLVLGTDGLWEWLEPDTVVRLVSDHMVGVQTLTPYRAESGVSIGQTTIKRVPFLVVIDLNRRKAGESKRPIDENCATHLIRQALGGAFGDGLDEQYRRLAETLHLPSEIARDYRDDITVTVVYFDQDYLAQFEAEFD